MIEWPLVIHKGEGKCRGKANSNVCCSWLQDDGTKAAAAAAEGAVTADTDKQPDKDSDKPAAADADKVRLQLIRLI